MKPAGKQADWLWWIWAFCSENLTVYFIQPGRGYEQATAVLGADFDGFLVRDGWIVYQRFARAFHQTCLAHLLRLCREMLKVAGPGAAELPRAVKEIFQASLHLQDRRDQNQIKARGLAIARRQLEACLDRTLDRSYRSPTNQRSPTTCGGNGWRCSPSSTAWGWRRRTTGPNKPFLLVVTRKAWGGNRTENGAHTQSVLVSILQTCRQQLRPATGFFERLLHLRTPQALDLTPPARR